MESSDLRLCEQGIMQCPDGSAEFAEGDTVVLASVYGPIAVKSHEERMDRATVKVNFCPRSGLSGVAEKALENYVTTTYEGAILVSQYPRTCITISIQEMEQRGSIVSAAINAVCLALMDAGLPLKYLVAGVTCVITRDGEEKVNPTHRDFQENVAVLTFAFDSTEKRVLSVQSRGLVSEERFFKCLHLCRKASESVFQFYHDIVRKKFIVEV